MLSELAPHDKDGNFVRDYDPSSVVSTHGPLSKEGRYRVYLGNPCPWCHRVYMALLLLKPENVEVVRLVDDAERASKGGWVLPGEEGGVKDLYGVYKKYTNGEYGGRATAPLLVDLNNGELVSNESNDILRLLQILGTTGVTMVPEGRRGEIEEANEWGYRLLQNGCYRCGFATTQGAYDDAAGDVLEGLRKLDKRLGESRFIVGDRVTEADVKMYPWAERFDGAYTTIFKAPGGGVGMWGNIDRWRGEMRRIKGMGDTVDVEDAVGSYYRQLFMLNPGGIQPRGEGGWEEGEEWEDVLCFV